MEVHVDSASVKCMRQYYTYTAAAILDRKLSDIEWSKIYRSQSLWIYDRDVVLNANKHVFNFHGGRNPRWRPCLTKWPS